MEAFSHEVVGPLTDAELRLTPVPVSGTVVATPSGTQDVNVTNASLAVTGPLTDTQLRATPVPVSGTVSTSPVTSNSATYSQVTSNSANQTLAAANANRKKVILFFKSGVWSVKFGAGASVTSRTVEVATGSYILSEETWKGQIDAICTTNGKIVDITEMV